MTTNTEAPEETGALACVQKVNVLEVFTRDTGPDEILEAIRVSVLNENEVVDLSTKKGRDAVASRAYSVRKAKTVLDDFRKVQVADWKKQAKEWDVKGKRLRDGCDEIAAEVRQPLTEWEEAEKTRQEAEAAAAKLEADWDEALLMNRNVDLERKIAAQEEAERKRLEAEEAKRRKEEREKAAAEEKVRLEQERKEREERIAREAEERAKREAEEKIQAEKDRAEKAEAERIAEAARAEERARQAREQAEREKQEAIKAERERIEAEQKAKEEADRKAAEDKDRRDQCHNEALGGLIQGGLAMATAELAVELIAAGRVPHVRMDYAVTAEEAVQEAA